MEIGTKLIELHHPPPMPGLAAKEVPASLAFSVAATESQKNVEVSGVI